MPINPPTKAYTAARNASSRANDPKISMVLPSSTPAAG
jgi:hypothetical protein